MSNFANKVTSAAPCHTVFVRTKRKRFAYVKAGNGQDRVSCVVGGGVRCSQLGVGGESLPILNQYGALALCDKHYNVMHTLSVEENIQTLREYCQRRGGNR